MNDLEKTCEHNLLVNASRERIKEGERATNGMCVTCHETVEIRYGYHPIGDFLYGKNEKDNKILQSV